ncbi:serum paraoxonase/arylesterase 2-like [Polypterus senegalus]|uniref:serum paraoxonase/arylesterase 2-like n=1 Tax=Polypterus senegalus TaxID=55291 RepID=UPI0019635FA6|nr:serum paraoxonase/arylesterase 2-like [Polypterus senegalus]
MGRVIVLVAFLGILLALFAERFITFRSRILATRELKQNHLPNCQYLKGIAYGSEDIAILPNGLALISSGLKYPLTQNFAPDVPGKILVLDLEEDVLKPVELRISHGFDLQSFNPHGISAYIDHTDDTVYLFVVNHLHPHFTSQIELFKFLDEDNTLIHLKTIKHELLLNVNDIVAIGPETFYASSDHYFTDTILRIFEKFVGLAWCNIIYYSPGEVISAAADFGFANGINISPDGRYIYVADLLDSIVHVLEIQDNKTLTRVKVINVGSLPDNIHVDHETGDLWIGCHPNGWKFSFYNKDDPPGSEILRIKNIHSEKPVVIQEYADNGSVLQGSSVAVNYDGKVLIGTVFHKALCCDLH